jgi:hypothetical protein
VNSEVVVSTPEFALAKKNQESDYQITAEELKKIGQRHTIVSLVAGVEINGNQRLPVKI